MKLEISGPSTKLAAFVKQYWAINSCTTNGLEHTQRIVPHGLPELTFYFGNNPKNPNLSGSANNSLFLSGQMNGYTDLNLRGKISIFSILFQPTALAAFFKFPIHELYNKQIALNNLDGLMTNNLESKLFEAVSFHERIRITETFLLKLLDLDVDETDRARISTSINLINSTRGNISVEKLASRACLSRKQFERVFLKHVGATPKQFQKVIRFQSAIYAKAINKEMNLTALSYHCGYYDQPHMINDFKQFTGSSPKQFFQDGETYSDYFN